MALKLIKVNHSLEPKILRLRSSVMALWVRKVLPYAFKSNIYAQIYSPSFIFMHKHNKLKWLV